jgi:hypothetical protein
MLNKQLMTSRWTRDLPFLVEVVTPRVGCRKKSLVYPTLGVTTSTSWIFSRRKATAPTTMWTPMWTPFYLRVGRVGLQKWQIAVLGVLRRWGRGHPAVILSGWEIFWMLRVGVSPTFNC